MKAEEGLEVFDSFRKGADDEFVIKTGR